VLPLRCADYDATMLDMLCLSGRVGWGRRSMPAAQTSQTTGTARRTGPVRATPIALFMRGNAAVHDVAPLNDVELHAYAQQVLDVLQQRGASFFHEIVVATRMLPTQVEEALGTLVSHGLITSDSFSGLRALLVPPSRRGAPQRSHRRARRGSLLHTVETAGRWSLLQPAVAEPSLTSSDATAHADAAPPSDARLRANARLESDARVEQYARALLRRYGVVFRTMLTRESDSPPWRELLAIYRRLEARGEIRGGRFLQGPSGEQFALPEAVGLLRSVRRDPPNGVVIAVSGADPLNLVGIITPEEQRVPAVARNRVFYRDGIAVATIENGELRRLVADVELPIASVPAAARRYFATVTVPPTTAVR
jgi:ATP-dependent Lhr-like helicase